MPLTNPWVGYLTRTYQQIKSSLINRLVTAVPEMTDHSSSNILVVIVDMFAGIGEMLNLYIDNMAREAFIMTARRFSSMVKLVKLLDYRIKAAVPATADLVVTFNTTTTLGGTIPIGSSFKKSNGITFLSTKDVVVADGAINCIVPVKQWALQAAVNLGATLGIASQRVPLGTNYVHDTLTLNINSALWVLVQSLGLSKPTDKHFIVEIDSDGIAYAIFGDGQNGAIPTTGYPILGTYYTTFGSNGNADANTIVVINSVLSMSGVTTFTVNNPNPASGGADYQTLQQIRVSAPLSIRTLERAVTRQDYIDIARLHPGVGKADLYFECGKTVDIYIAPIGGGIASSVLLDDVVDWFESKRMITTKVLTKAAGQTRIVIKIVAVARFREVIADVRQEIINKLYNYGSFANQDINKAVRGSDIYSLIDNLLRVDYLNLVRITVKPYAHPINHTRPLNWDITELDNSLTKVKWNIDWYSSQFRIFRDGNYLTTVPENTIYTDPLAIAQITPKSGVYNYGDQWEFYTYPINSDIILDDFTMPYINLSDLDITVLPTISAPIQ